MKLYDCAIAPNPRRARMFLAEKDLVLPRVEVDILGGENLREAFLAINPRGLLPVLEFDDGGRIDEVMAICHYFEQIQPEPRLLGRTPREQALVLSRQRKMEFDGMIATSEVFRNQHPEFARRSLPGGGRDNITAIPELVTRGRQSLQRFFHWLEIYLSEHAHVAGDEFSMADITAFCAIDFAAWVDIRIPAEHARTQAWYARVAARPSARVARISHTCSAAAAERRAVTGRARLARLDIPSSMPSPRSARPVTPVFSRPRDEQV